MQLSVNYYRGAKLVELAIARLTLLCGMNGHGKSSVADALAALLTGKSLPGWMKKKDAAQFVSEESGAGRITLTSDDGEVSIEYPTCSVTASGRPPQATPVAAGLESPLDMTDRDRSAYFATLLKTNPTEQELREALKDAELSDKDFTALWNQVKISGWDAAYTTAGDTGKLAKGGWMHVTSEAYGSQKGANWRPAGWTEKHDRMTVSGCDTRIKELNAERDKATSRKAVDEHELASLRSMADGYDEAVSMRDEAATEARAARKALDEKRKSAPTLLSIDDQPCPACGAPLSIKAGKIVSGGTVTEKEVEASRKAAKKHADEVEKLDAEYQTACSAAEKVRELVSDCESARKKLDALPAAQPAGRTVEEIDRDLDGAHIDRDMIERRSEADRYHADIQRQTIIVSVLAPEGLRHTVLTRALGAFNGWLGSLSQGARWGKVSLTDDLDVMYGNRPYRLLSTSEKFRVRVTMQLVIAELDGSDAIVIDAADVLDRAGRNGLIKAVLSTEIPALVCMTMNARDDMPDVGKVGGESVWIEEGVTVTHNEPVGAV